MNDSTYFILTLSKYKVSIDTCTVLISSPMSMYNHEG